MRIIILTTLLMFCLPVIIMGQKTSIYDQPEAGYRLAVELFNRKQYNAALNQFKKVIDKVDDKDSEIKINSRYYQAICAFELFHPDAENLLISFINKHPVHPKQSIASFQMGNLQYRNRNYEDALKWYAKVDMFDLNNEQTNEFKFKSGHSYFELDDYDNAKRKLFDVKDTNSVYYEPANYYYGHIAYTQHNYETALRSFKKLIDDSNFGMIVPYYITNIYHKQRRYDDLIEYAPAILEEASPNREIEIHRLLGDAYYSKKNYEKAIVYFEEYRRQTREKLTRDDHYQFAYSYYKINDYKNAINYFEPITTEEDSLAQNAYYLLADCYLKIDDKMAAKNALNAAKKMDFIPQIKQDALFKYAKLSYELSYNPFNEAILSFQKYIEDYPDSPRIDEAYEYLIDLFLTTRNYRYAMESMEKIEINTQRLKDAYQRIAYYRGVELFNNGDFETAIDYFNRSNKYPENNAIMAQSKYWTGEAKYRMGNYDEAIEIHNRFLVTPGAYSLDQYNRANYNIGYAYFRKEQYEKAIRAFRKFVTDEAKDTRLLVDAQLRLGDSYFVTKNYRNAIDYYDKAIKRDIAESDYAMFQKSIALGAIGNYDEKANSLIGFLQKYPNSNYLSDAKYELANTYLVMDDPENALKHYSGVIDDHPNSNHVKSAMLKKGLIYYNSYEDEKALEQFKNVVENYRGTEQSQEALEAMKIVYVNLDRVDDYVEYTEGLGLSDITAVQRDSLTYVAAENRYMEGDWVNAARSFENYLDKYPDGIFNIDANYYGAESYYRMGEYNHALTGYEYVANKRKSRFSEKATVRAASINYKLGNYADALSFYKQLEKIADHSENLSKAKIGQMRCFFKVEQYEQAIDVASKVLENDKIIESIRQEAFMIKGYSAKELNQLDIAKNHFSSAATIRSNETSAEAKYNIALIEFRKGNYDNCEKLILDYVNTISAYEYWLAKMFILLADNYTQKGNLFQARHTLQSIIDNYDGPELASVARKKLEEIESKKGIED